jgi:hypothetical protein
MRVGRISGEVIQVFSSGNQNRFHSGSVYFCAVRQDFVAIAGYEDSVLELGGELAIYGNDRPFIF